MIGLKISKKKEEVNNGNKVSSNIPIYDISRLPEEYLRNEFPEEWRALNKGKKYYNFVWYS